MKTIEQKARAYDEAFERAKEKYTTCYSPALLEYIFPELKESEDEKIRKQILSFLKEFEYDHYRNLDFSSWIAWLEKQESCYSFEIKKGHWYKCVCDYMLNNSDLMFKNDRLYYCRSDWRLRGEIDERNVKNIGVNGYKSFFRPATNQEIKEWLEKQGKQKSTEHNENEEPQVYETKDGEVITYSETNGYKIVEPKFKVGDWISNDVCDVHIASIENEMYYFDEGDGLSIVFVDEHYHLWTIEDAMDGDVLAFKNNSGIIICKSPTNYDTRSYCRLIYDNFINKEESGWDSTLLVPATKEQRDILMEAMSDTGYTFNFEKKELKKVEQETLCDKCRKEHPSHSCQDITELGRCSVEHEQKSDNSYCQENCKGFQETGKCFADGDCEAKREAESNDKNEPKFHEGDWVIYNNDICQIVKREEGCNILVTQFGVEKEPVNERNLSTAKLWDISDANEGDVLVSRSPFIYGKQCPYGGLNRCNNKFIKASNFIFTDSPVHPATKEQRDILFSKMKKAGYEWHINKKELRKKE